jgi:Phage Mu protein F like protein
MPKYRRPGPPPNEALAFFRAKKLKPGFDYRDVWREEHATAFTVAKAMEIDLLYDIQGALDQAIEEGLPLAQFKKNLKPTLVRQGWWGKSEETDPVTGEKKMVELGSPRRLRTIYRTNINIARAAGQEQRMQRTKRSHPYAIYELGPSREHRQEHVDWAGTTLPIDDPWWDTHAPINGWGCNCRRRAISKREYQRKLGKGEIKTKAPQIESVKHVNKRTGEVISVPRGIDPGFDTNPGKVARDQYAAQILAERMKKAPATISSYAMEHQVAFVKQGMARNYEQKVQEAINGERPKNTAHVLTTLLSRQLISALTNRNVNLKSAAVTLKDTTLQRLSNASSTVKNLFLKLPSLMGNQQVVYLDASAHRLIYLAAASDTTKWIKVVVTLGVLHSVESVETIERSNFNQGNYEPLHSSGRDFE